MRTLLVAFLLLPLAACASHDTKAPAQPAKANAGIMKPVNRHCPIQGEDEVDPKVTVMYKGQVVGFCCSECIDDWARLPDDLKDAKLKKSM